MASLAHLSRRFFGSLWPTGPSKADEEWALSHLTSTERVLWRQMSRADRRHGVAVARGAIEHLGQHDDRVVVSAALLHDVGKVRSGLGTFGRVAATVYASAAGERARSGRGAVGRYLRHDVLGAEILAEAGSHPVAVRWAEEHHLPPGRWTVPTAIASALKAADGD